MDIIDYFSDNIEAFLFCIAFFALFIGSFLNVAIYRLPKMMEQSWSEDCRVYLGLKSQQPEGEKLGLSLPFSHCPSCKKKILPWHNIPLVSYLYLRGKCANCQAVISLRYPLVEAITCLMSVYIAWRFGVSLQTLYALAFTWIIIALTFIDLDYHLLPDQLTLTLLWIGLLASLSNVFATSHDAIIGAVTGYLIFAITQWIFEWATGKTGMGQGDVKFLAALGAFLGWQMLPLVILLASVSGIIFALTHMFIKKQYKSVPIPFGPYLAVAGWIALIWGSEIMRFYFYIMG